MQQGFFYISSSTWNIIFLVVRYVLVALLLAYLTTVYVKKKSIHTDIKGRVLEWRVDTYKSIHRWVMQFKNVIAAPSQYEEYYRNILSQTQFKIGYQGMEYVSFFDSPERLFQFGLEFKKMLNKEEDFMDYNLLHALEEFKYWLDDVVMYYGAFAKAECDKRWKFNAKTVEQHCRLACKVLGIALQDDLNKFYAHIDDLLRDRLRNIKISGVYNETLGVRIKKKAIERCESIMDKEVNGRYKRGIEWFYNKVFFHTYGSSQMRKQQFGMMTIFMLIHFEEQFAKNPDIINDQNKFMKLMTEYTDCLVKYIER